MSTPSPRILGSNYVRWGRTVCPGGTGAEIVYSGRAAGPSITNTGGGANMLCLPDNPDYLSLTSDSIEGFDWSRISHMGGKTRSSLSKLSMYCLLRTKSYDSNDSSKNSVPTYLDF